MPDKGPTGPTCRGHYTGFAMLYSIYRFCGWCRTNPSSKWEYWSVGCYGERDTGSKREAQIPWRGHVQAIVATKAFGMEINKPGIRHIIRHGVPKSLSSWLQELGWAGHDGNPAQAYIFYAERDTDNAWAWIRDHLQNQQAVYNILKIFSWKLEVCLCSPCWYLSLKDSTRSVWKELRHTQSNSPMLWCMLHE